MFCAEVHISGWMLRVLKKHPIKTGVSLILVGLAILAILYFLAQTFGLDKERVSALIDGMNAWVSGKNPLYYVLMVALCPLIGFPVSPFLIVAGGFYGYGMGTLWAMCGIALSNILGYWIGGYGFRDQVERFLVRKAKGIPAIPHEHTFRVIVLFRLTPGIPLCIQNYLLGFARVPFKEYFWLSLLLNIIPVTGFVIFGGSIFKGNIGLALVGVSLLIVVAIGSKLLYNYLQNRKKAPHVFE